MNQDTVVDISDAIALARAYFVPGSPSLSCEQAGDVDDDGRISGIGDALFLLSSLFLDGPPVPPPAQDCGQDSTPDLLTCETTSCP